jgi:hypothetical protein
MIYVAWIAITMLGARLISNGEATLDELVSTSIGWQFAAAIGLLLFAIKVFKWHDLNFTRPHSLVRVMWFPAIYLVLFAGVVMFIGAPAWSVVMFVTINTLMVGVSEEVMFRGVLFRAFDKAMSIWLAIILTSILFGAVHILNVFITGQLGPAIMQSIAAVMSGFVFMAILIRTGSIWPAIIYHFFWDCLLFLAGNTAGTTAPEAATHGSGAIGIYVPVLLNLPNFIFALILLRNVGKHGSTHKSANQG